MSKFLFIFFLSLLESCGGDVYGVSFFGAMELDTQEHGHQKKRKRKKKRRKVYLHPGQEEPKDLHRTGRSSGTLQMKASD